jgi:exodeoxyribonuclease VII large subunit
VSVWRRTVGAVTAQLFTDSVRKLSLVKLSGEIVRAVVAIGRVAVEGEVHRPKVGRTGWMYFTLRDRAVQINVVVPAKRQARTRARDGERVEVVGRVQWSNEYGQLQLMADEVAPVGAGAIAAMVAEVRERLRAEGVLDRPRRPLPMLPRCVGVVCGADAAVRHDIQSIVDAQFARYPVRFVETAVSGPGAVDGIVAALETLTADPEVEVIILARGGGDPAQLRPFSDEAVCRAICAAPVPVVSAIGHEGDRPLCDEVADHRYGTPSIAARHVVPDRTALEANLAAYAERLRARLQLRVDLASRRLAAIEPWQALSAGVDTAERRIARAGDRLALRHPRTRVAAATARLDGLARQLDALSPTRVLERGYAVVRGPDGRVLRAASGVDVGARVDVQLADGALAARVEEVVAG